jgi:hypothetical protein
MTTIANKIGFIYKIVCNDPEIKDCYVGSCQSFRTRKNSHKTVCSNSNSDRYNLNVYQFIRANGGWSNWSMIAIEQVNYTIKHELLMRERYHLERLRATLNKQIPTRTHQEYRNEHKTEANQYQKQHYEANKTEIIEKQKRYNEANKTEIAEKRKELITCNCGSTLRKSDILRHYKSKNHKQYDQIYNFIYS